MDVRNTHAAGRLLTVKNSRYVQDIKRFVFASFESDAVDGDITTSALSRPKKNVEAKIFAKGKGIVAGLEEAAFFLEKKFGYLRFKLLAEDGKSVKKGEVIISLTGPFIKIMECERTLLNLLGRMSGIATLTNEYVKKAGNRVLVTPTRKTYWGMLDKKACFAGRGGTHRFNLGDAVIFKDTHMKFSKEDLRENLKKLLKTKGRFIEIEVQTEAEALKVVRLINEERISSKNVIIMFDNFSAAGIKRTLLRLKKEKLTSKIKFEASGGITLKNIGKFAKTGVHVISCGALTHSAKALDFSLKIN